MIGLGIELPVELRGVAERTGTHWPEADEDAMREAAGAWRRAAESLDGLAANSDASAGGALAAVEGEAGRAAGRHWRGFVEPDTGRLPTCARECRAAADRLDHAAEQVGATKVRIVRELVALAKQTDAAERAAAAGNPSAALRAESAVGTTAGNVTELNRGLVRAVDSASGVGVDSGASPGSGLSDEPAEGPVRVGSAENPASAVAPVADAVDSAVDGAGPPSEPERLVGAEDEAAGPPGEAPGWSGEPDGSGGRIAELLSPHESGAAPDEAGPPSHAPAPGQTPDRELTGPVSPETLRRADGAAAAGPDAGTGPIPTVDPAASRDSDAASTAGTGGHGAGGERDPITSPQAVRQAWAPGPAAPPPPPPAQAGGVSPNPAPPPPPPAPPGQPGLSGQPPPAAQPQRPGTAAPPPPAAPGAGAGRAVGQFDHAQGAPRPGPPARGGYQPTGVAHPGAVPPAGRAPFAPGGGMSQQPVQPPQPAQSPAEGRRPLRDNQPESAVVAFVLHQFPLGHMPVAETRPSRQWSPSGQPSERDTFTVPPQSHPRVDLVEELDGVGHARSRSSRAARFAVSEPDRTIPGELLAGYEPLGTDEGVGEFEWERRYLVRGPTGDGTHAYDWPVRHGYQDNGAEQSGPEVLPPDTLLDRLGDEWGLVLAPAGTAFAHRSLPPEFRERSYRRYRVVRPLPVWLARAVAWFEQPGTGLRYRTTHPITELVALGFLVDPDTESGTDTEGRHANASGQDVSSGGVEAAARNDVPERDTAAGSEVTEQTLRIRSEGTGVEVGSMSGSAEMTR